MPGTRRIFAGVSGSPGSVHALRQAAQLAHHHDAVLIPVLAWLPPDSRRLPWPELRQIWHDDAWQRLRDTLDATFGGLPDGIATKPAVLRGNPRKVLTGVAPPGRRRASHRRLAARPPAADVGQPGQPLLPGPRPLPGAGHPSPSLAQQAGHGLRGWAFRHRWASPAGQRRTPAVFASAPRPQPPEQAAMNLTPLRQILARRPSPPGAGQPQPGQLNSHRPPPGRRPGRGGFAARFIPDVAAAATVAAGQNRPGTATANGWRRTMTAPRRLPHTIQLCIHCRHNPAGFWVSRNSSQTVCRPWCLCCCQNLDPGCYHVQPFDS